MSKSAVFNTQKTPTATICFTAVFFQAYMGHSVLNRALLHHFQKKPLKLVERVYYLPASKRQWREHKALTLTSKWPCFILASSTTKLTTEQALCPAPMLRWKKIQKKLDGCIVWYGGLKSRHVKFFLRNLCIFMVKFSKFYSESFHWNTDQCCSVQILWNLDDEKSVKSCIAYQTK